MLKNREISNHQSAKLRLAWYSVPLLVVAVLAAMTAPILQGDELDNADTQAIMKANFLFHFAAANEWPVETKKGPFRIVVIGNERLFQELIDKYALKSIGTQPLEIEFFEKNSEVSLSDRPHLVYLESFGDSVAEFIKHWEDEPVLMVTSSEAALNQGATINFISVDRRLRYEINQKAASNKGLLIGSRILSWAINSGK